MVKMGKLRLLRQKDHCRNERNTKETPKPNNQHLYRDHLDLRKSGNFSKTCKRTDDIRQTSKGTKFPYRPPDKDSSEAKHHDTVLCVYVLIQCMLHTCYICIWFDTHFTTIFNRSITWRNVEGGKNKCGELLSLWEKIQLAVTGRGWMCKLHRKILSPKHVPLLVSVNN